MARPLSRLLLLALPLSGCGCKDDGPGQSQTSPPDTEVGSTPFDDVAVTGEYDIGGLSCDVHVLRTEGDVPHIYARDRADLARVMGYVVARDRFFSIDLARRLGQGRVAQILGQDALSSDIESRATAMTFVAKQLEESFTPEQEVFLGAYAEGINAYIAAVKAGSEPVPSELALAGPLLGFPDPTELMLPFDLGDMAGFMAVLIYQLGYETDDVGRTANLARIPDFAGADLEALRAAGVWEDLWLNIKPIHEEASAPGWGLNGAVPAGSALTAAPPPPRIRAPRDLLDRMDARMLRFQKRLGRDDEVGFGSNSWAVAGSVASDGRALLAGDGHLPLSVPSLFYQVGLDTEVLGGGDLHQLGLTFPGMPLMAVGTNGAVAWSQTQLSGDITDWYLEEIGLDATGKPATALFQGDWLPMTATQEDIEIAEVTLLGSEGGTFSFSRWTTADGRWIADIEGQVLDPDDIPDPTAVVWMGGRPILPGDTNGDGKVHAVSFDYTALDPANILLAVDGFGHAANVAEFNEATRHLVAYSQNVVAADKDGSILYTGYQGVPCRGYLPKEGGHWIEGANPSLLLDGTTYGGFTIPLDADFKVDESQGADPYRCVVPFAEYPHAINPDQGYVITANNDPAGITFDGDLLNEPWYIGGPWTVGYRAHTIRTGLEQAIAEGWADLDGMAAIQGDQRSVMGLAFGPHLVAAIAHAREVAALDFVEPDSADARLAALYHAHGDRLDAVETRLNAWIAGGAPAASGVETFYHRVEAGEAEDAVATMIFNAWVGRFNGAVFDDEGLPDVWVSGGTNGRTRALKLFLDGRGDGNPNDLASFNPTTAESAFFDVLGTDEIETADEVMLSSLVGALDFLESPADGEDGGFGTAEMDAWLWGLKHLVTFDSLLADFLGDGGAYAFLVDQFSITTATLPLADSLASDDPRRVLEHFPRPGDNLAVDAANFGFNPNRFRYGSGPVFRMVWALGPDGVSGYNVLPGGQSALVDSPYFADQARLWLANDVMAMRFTVEEVIAGAAGHEVYSGGACD